MKAKSLSIDRQRGFAITADQRRSRSSPDRVPEALAALDGLAWELAVERTAGDEFQGLTLDPTIVVSAVTGLTRLGGWRIGIGAGTVELPLPSSTRAARGTAYILAREAIGAAGTLGLALRADEAHEADGHHAETALLALVALLERRSEQGWEVVDLADRGLSGVQMATQLGVTASAVSQRLARAEHVVAARQAELASWLLGHLEQETR